MLISLSYEWLTMRLIVWLCYSSLRLADVDEQLIVDEYRPRSPADDDHQRSISWFHLFGAPDFPVDEWIIRWELRLYRGEDGFSADRTGKSMSLS